MMKPACFASSWSRHGRRNSGATGLSRQEMQRCRDVAKRRDFHRRVGFRDGAAPEVRRATSSPGRSANRRPGGFRKRIHRDILERVQRNEHEDLMRYSWSLPMTD